MTTTFWLSIKISYVGIADNKICGKKPPNVMIVNTNEQGFLFRNEGYKTY